MRERKKEIAREGVGEGRRGRARVKTLAIIKYR